MSITNVPRSSEAETILSVLHRFGVGQAYGSTVSVLKTNVHFESVKELNSNKEATKSAEGDNDLAAGEESLSVEDVNKFDKKVEQFYNSIKSRMMVGEVIVNIENNAQFTFDFLMLLILAGN